MHTPDLKNFLHEDMIEAGCDEAGRGPLAGPVFAASVILPKDFFHPLLDDSKKMTAAHRDKVREVIEKEAVAWAVEEVSPAEIDELNILWASVTGMQRAVLRLNPKPEFLLIDGNKFRPFDVYSQKNYQTVVKGDATYAPIAAASVLAKTWRDEFMRKIARNIRSTAGNATWATLPRSTSPPSGNTATPRITACPSTPKNSSPHYLILLILADFN